MIYLDSSAITKLFAEEPETDALRRFLQTQPGEEVLAASIIAATEVRRAATGRGLSQELASVALSGITLIELERDTCVQAGLLPGGALRSLDALHVATAVRVRATAFLTYDRRQAAAARANGLRVLSPA